MFDESLIKIHSEAFRRDEAVRKWNMKTIMAWIMTAAGAWLSGCASDSGGMILDTVGPAPVRVSSVSSANGILVVFSAYEVNADFNARDPRRPEYSDYRILTADGHLPRRVHNNSGTILQTPQQVELPAGCYSVRAQANGYGLVIVPVLIEAGRVTVLHLEGGARWPPQFEFNRTNAVRLPDGEIVGWKASPFL